MAVSSELACMLEAVKEPAMLIRPQDMTVACVNKAFSRVFGAFGFEGKLCWEALHRPRDCAHCGLECPWQKASETLSEATVSQTVYGAAHAKRFSVSLSPIMASDATLIYWLERIEVLENEGVIRHSRGYVGVSKLHEKTVREMAESAAGDDPVWISGEAGTGKELYARTVHENSSRAAQPFVLVQGADLTDSAARKLLGAGSTAGVSTRLFQRANAGTLFVDHIEKIGKLAARLIVTEIARAKKRSVPGFRLMASSDESVEVIRKKDQLPPDLTALFMSDAVHVASLRERKVDIAPLAKHFIRGIAPYNTYRITREALQALTQCDWAGNMRALRDALEAAAERCQKYTIRVDDLVLEEASESGVIFYPGRELMTLDELRDRYLMWVVGEFKGSRQHLAEKLGLSQRTLYRLAAQAKKLQHNDKKGKNESQV